MKGIRLFFSHAGFYQRFIKDFSKIAKPLCSLLEANRKLFFDEQCMTAFQALKTALTIVPTMSTLNWDSPFELMCDASDHVVGAMLRKKKGNVLHPIYYASKMLNEAQLNYATTKKKNYLL